MWKAESLQTPRACCRALPVIAVAATLVSGVSLAVPAAIAGLDRETIWIDVTRNLIGAPPPDFDFWQSGGGRRGQWSIVRDASTASGAAIEQFSARTQEGQLPLAIYQPNSLKNVEVSARIELVQGPLQTAGLAVRVTSADSYYVAVVNALEGRVELFRYADGARERLAGVDADVRSGHWQTLRITAENDHFSVSLDGRPLFEAWDHSYGGDGHIALWTEEDNITRFDNIAITPIAYTEGRQ